MYYTRNIVVSICYVSDMIGEAGNGVKWNASVLQPISSEASAHCGRVSQRQAAGTQRDASAHANCSAPHAPPAAESETSTLTSHTYLFHIFYIYFLGELEYTYKQLRKMKNYTGRYQVVIKK